MLSQCLINECQKTDDCFSIVCRRKKDLSSSLFLSVQPSRFARVFLEEVVLGLSGIWL